MRTPIVAGNWKMNKLTGEANSLASDIADASSNLDDVELIVGPTHVSLPTVAEAIGDADVGLASQNIHWAESGAFTGELSPAMLKDVGCTHAIIGHSERREYFGETDASVNRRLRAALEADIVPIVCVGESLDERNDGEMINKISMQVRAALTGVSAADASEVVVAYEPLWAIGTGETATPDQAQEAHATLRNLLSDLYDSETADAVRILYGGSVKPHNIAELYEQPDLDGALVGGASLEADSFISIAQTVQEKQ